MMTSEEHAIAQQDECDSMAAIFADEFALLSRQDEPISYSIQLAPSDFSPDTDTADHNQKITASLAVTYPTNYPDTIPSFGLVYDPDRNNNNESCSLHAVQERALLETITTAAHAELGMPSVYSCIHAANEFIENGGLIQAGIALLSDDCLAHILVFLATSKDDVENICVALPLFEPTASKTNIVWRQLCQLRWREKWGFRERWERALDNFEKATTSSAQQHSNQHFWMQTYNDEEEDAKRNSLTRDELSAMTFDYRQWFSFTLFRNQPDNMRDVLPTGLRQSLARDVTFTPTGVMHSERDWLRRLSWKTSNHDDDRAITDVRLKLISNGCSVESLTVYRLLNWGWELRGGDYLFRAVDGDEAGNAGLWEDLTTNIIVEKKPEWVDAHRGPYPYSFREIPDDEDCKILDW
ncbi:hypothetical protein ACHAXR_013487 [Thalassiosira sp. AJA248-18]